MYERYRDWSETTANTLALMDWEKINYDLVEAMVVFVADGGTRDCPLPTEGSILVFLPGMQEIMTLHDNLSSHPRIGRSGKFLLVPLHSSLTSEQQQLVFSRQAAILHLIRVLLWKDYCSHLIVIDERSLGQERAREKL